MSLDYSDRITFNINRVTFNGEFTHWEGDLVINDEETASCTAPDFLGIVDNLIEYLYDEESELIEDSLSLENE